MLANDTRARREATEDKSQQSILSDHFGPRVSVVPYSDQAFEASAIEWLIDSNQVRSLLLSLYSNHFKTITRAHSCV